MIEYICMPIEDFEANANRFDIVLSSLAFHYINSFSDICDKVNHWLVQGDSFVFSVEHPASPIFTAYGTQDWYYNEQGNSR